MVVRERTTQLNYLVMDDQDRGIKDIGRELIRGFDQS